MNVYKSSIISNHYGCMTPPPSKVYINTDSDQVLLIVKVKICTCVYVCVWGCVVLKIRLL